MNKQLENILWMGEELDFEVKPENKNEARGLIDQFLELVKNPELSHTLIEPADTIPNLEAQLKELHTIDPFSLVIDLTRGKLSPHLPSLSRVQQWRSFSIGRIRESNNIELPTAGHMISHNLDEIRQQLCSADLSHVLLLDDTSFSGATSLLVEDLLRTAFPEQKIRVTHGFLIVNVGKLDANKSARTRLEKNGSRVLAGFEMETPRDDGWHFFDIVSHDNIEQHLHVVCELLHLIASKSSALIASFLCNSDVLHYLFPNVIQCDELHDLQRSGHFLPTASKELSFEGPYVRNPQILQNTIGQNHILKPNEWRASQHDVLPILRNLNQLLQNTTT